MALKACKPLDELEKVEHLSERGKDLVSPISCILKKYFEKIYIGKIKNRRRKKCS